jgi:hypothetical protein
MLEARDEGRWIGSDGVSVVWRWEADAGTCSGEEDGLSRD